MTNEPGIGKEEFSSLLDQPGQPKGKKGRRVLIVCGVVVLLLVGIAALLPKLASPLLSGREVFRSGGVVGTIQSSSLGWFGGQRVRVGLSDPKNQPSGSLDISIDRGLLALARNWSNLGTVRITGDAEIRESAAAPVPPSKPGTTISVSATTDRIALPRDLAARIEVQLSRLAVLDAAGKPVAELRDLTSNADIRIGSPLTLDFAAKTGASPISAKVKIDNWTQADGAIHLDTASLTKNSPRVDATLDFENLSVALVDALVAAATGTDRNLRGILGETITVRSTAAGDFSGGRAAIDAISPNTAAKARLTIANGVLSLAEPASVRLLAGATGAVLDTFARTGGASNGLAITQAPAATVTVEELSLKLPTQNLDLRGARVRAGAVLEGLQGKVALGENQPASDVSIPSFRVGVVSEDLATTARVTAQADSTITTEGRAASGGTLSADIGASGLLDANGALVSGLPRTIDGRITLKGASTGILQPLAAGALGSSGIAIDLPRDIGPVADVEVVAKTKEGVIDLDLTAGSQFANAAATLRVAEDLIVAGDKGINITLNNAGAIAGRAMKSPTLTLSRPGGRISVVVSSLNLPLDRATRSPKLDQMTAQAGVRMSDWGFAALVPAAAEQVAGRAVAIDLQTLAADISIEPGSAGRVKVASEATADGSPVRANADLQLPHLASALGGPKPGPSSGLAQKLGPAFALGRVQVTGIPASLADALPRSRESTMSIGAVARGAIGETFDATIDLSQPAGSQAVSYKADVRGGRADLGATGTLDAASLVLQTSGKGTLAPELIEALFPGNAGDKPRLRAPASYTFASDAVSIPLDSAGGLAFEKAGDLKARAAITGQAIVQSGPQAYGVQDLTLTTSLPLAALGSGSGGAASLQAGAVLLSADGAAMGTLGAKGAAPLGPELSLAGPAEFEVRVSDIKTDGLDRALGQPLLVSGALGPTAAVTATTRITPPAGKRVGIGEAISAADLAADITLVAQRLEIKRPLRVRAEGDRLSLEASDPIAWTIEPAWFDRFVLGKGQGATETDLALAGAARAELLISRAVVARANPEKGIAGPLYPGVFALDATARIPALELRDSRGVRTQMGDAVLKLQSVPAAPGQAVALAFDLSFARLTVVPDPAGSGPGGGNVKGSLSGIATPTGAIDTANPMVTARGEIRALPSALVDAFSVKNGLPGEILGPSVNVNLDAQNFSKAGGSVAFSAVSTEAGSVTENGATRQVPRAEMSLKGTAQNGVLVTPLNITLRRVDVGLQRRLSNVLPLIADVEKRFEDRPTVVASPSIAIPLDGNTARLNGTLSIDPGDARFKTSGTFGALLRAVKTKDQGKMLQRLKPVDLTINNGVITYPRWAFPMGEFNTEIEGTVDLPRSYVDMVAWVPFGQLVDDVAGLFSRIPGVGTAGNIINQTTMVPIRFSGPMGNTKATGDVGLFSKNLIKNVSPEKVVDVLKDIFKKPK